MIGILKRLEQAGRWLLLAGVTRLVARSSASAPDWTAGPVRVLFLRPDRIGDMVVSTAVMHAIVRQHPNIVLDVLASPLNAPVLEADPHISDVIRFDRRRRREYVRVWRQLRAARYDVVVDPMVFNQSVTTLMMVLASGAPHRVGVMKPGKPNVYTMPAERNAAAGDHMLDHLAQLVIPFGGSADDAKQMRVGISDAERDAARAQWGEGRRVLVNISAGEKFRTWADERYASIARQIRTRVPSARVLIMHGPDERARADDIAHAAGVHRADTPTLRAAMALVAEAEFVFTPDTSVVHLAGAFNVPTVAMFTSDKVVRWAPRADGSRSVVGRGATIDSVELDDAARATSQLLDEIFSESRAETESSMLSTCGAPS